MLRWTCMPWTPINQKLRFQNIRKVFTMLHSVWCQWEGISLIWAQQPLPPDVQTFSFQSTANLKRLAVYSGWTERQFIRCTPPLKNDSKLLIRQRYSSRDWKVVEMEMSIIDPVLQQDHQVTQDHAVILILPAFSSFCIFICLNFVWTVPSDSTSRFLLDKVNFFSLIVFLWCLFCFVVCCNITVYAHGGKKIAS